LRAGEPSEEIFTVYSGWAYRYLQLPDGRRQILTFLLPGDAISIELFTLLRAPIPYAVKALSPLIVCAFDVGAMRDLVLSTQVQRESLAKVFASHMAMMDQHLALVGRKKAGGRVAYLLLELEQRLRERNLSDNGSFDLPARQEDLADALGLTAVHVNRTLVGLRQRGLIQFERGRMSILDFERLKQIADDE
jgi:CRP-like cAMP-binding protein